MNFCEDLPTFVNILAKKPSGYSIVSVKLKWYQDYLNCGFPSGPVPRVAATQQSYTIILG